MSTATLQRPRPADATAGKPAPTDQEVQAYLATGLHNRWYPILPARFIEPGGKPLGLVRLGEPLVVWRDAKGGIHVQADRCPHRAVPLSRGINEGDRLRCNYHGVEVGPDGKVLAVPGQPGCPLEGKKAVKTYPAQEIAGAIFVWFGDALNEEAPAFKPPEQLVADEFSNFLCYADWEMPWRYAFDNYGSHARHVPACEFAHHVPGRHAGDLRHPRHAARLLLRKTGQRDVNFDWSELVDHNALYVRLEIPYPPSGGPGGNFIIIGFGTPIDADRMCVFFWRVRKVSGWQRDTWRFLYKTNLEPRHWHVLEQDREMLDGLKPGLEKYEMLYQHDAGVIRLRRYLAQQARQQLVALKAAGKA